MNSYVIAVTGLNVYLKSIGSTSITLTAVKGEALVVNANGSEQLTAFLGRAYPDFTWAGEKNGG